VLGAGVMGAQIAAHCTTQENNANRVEREVLKAAGALLLHGRIGESFDAIVTGAAAKGTFVRAPKLSDVPYPVQMEPNLVVEFYSR